jgi:hypothetical protein
MNVPKPAGRGNVVDPHDREGSRPYDKATGKDVGAIYLPATETGSPTNHKALPSQPTANQGSNEPSNSPVLVRRTAAKSCPALSAT